MQRSPKNAKDGTENLRYRKHHRRNWYISQTNAKTKTFLIQNFQEFWDTMKRQNSRIIQIEEGEECQFKSPENVFQKITEENFPTLKKEIPINIKEGYRSLYRVVQKKNLHPMPQDKQNTKCTNKERISKATREKGKVRYKCRPGRITTDFSTDTLNDRRARLCFTVCKRSQWQSTLK